jgi:hypothetical protein
LLIFRGQEGLSGGFFEGGGFLFKGRKDATLVMTEAVFWGKEKNNREKKELALLAVFAL